LLSYPVAAAKNSLVRASLAFAAGRHQRAERRFVYNESLAEIVKLLPLDSSFTGRTEIWEFAIASLNLRPLFGYGSPHLGKPTRSKIWFRRPDRVGRPPRRTATTLSRYGLTIGPRPCV